MKKSTRIWNPYLTSYLTLAMLCCIALSILFLYINLENTKRNETIHNQEKLRLITKDMENQFETFKKMNLQISVNKLYQPFYFQRNKYYELTLLNDFAQYQNYSPIVDEYFLYYPDSQYIYHSDEYTINLDTYLNTLSNDECLEIRQLLTNPDKPSFFSTLNQLYFLLPVSAMVSANKPTAILCLITRHNTLHERFQTVSGGLNGLIALYSGNLLLYSNSTSPLSLQQKNILTFTTDSGTFSAYYLPDARAFSKLLPLQILLVIAVIILALFIASLFAYHSYKPILLLTQKYRPAVPGSPKAQFKNEFDEINFMMESILNNNIAANDQLEQKQELLRNQLLILLLNGKYSFDIHPYLSQVRLMFPGPCYFVTSVSFGQEDLPESGLLEQLSKLFEELSDSQEGKYLYAIIDKEQNIIAILCSISEKLQWEEVYIDIRELSESFGHVPLTGHGNVYNTLNHMSASYLEALDSMHKTTVVTQDNNNPDTAYLSIQADLYQICSALSNGNEPAAMDALQRYLLSLGNWTPSLLMQQYLFTNFLSEITRLSREYYVELSKQSISLIISAKNLSQFAHAAESLIHDFCASYEEQKNKLQENESYQIFQYINEHFADYELSIENIALSLNTTTASVRSAIGEHTGRNYKDYLIYMRMEYAKKLLTIEHLTVAETCQRVGYSNISYFIKVFKIQNGVTPASYKNSGI